MKKKIFLFLLTVFAITCMFVVSSSAATTLAEPIDDVYYTIDESKLTATVNTKNQSNTATIIEIPSEITYNGNTYKVTAIESNAFDGNKTMVELRILSEHITAIPSYMIAKTNDGALTKIFIDFSKITSIGNLAFSASGNINGPVAANFYFYDAAAYIADKSEVIITEPDFSNCTAMGEAAFQGANFEKVTIPAAVEIKIQTFRLSTITELLIEGETRNKIGYWAFAYCTNLKKIRIESKVTKFENTVFSGCAAIEEIYIDLSETTTIDGSAFFFRASEGAASIPVQWYNLDGEEVVDLSSVTSIGKAAFSTSNLGSAYIIWPNELSYIDTQVFRNCNISQTLVINAKDGSNLSVQYWSFAGNHFSGVVFAGDVMEIGASFSEASFAVIFTDSVKIQSSSFVSSSTPVYCKEITVNTSFNKIEIATGAPLIYGTCGQGAEVKFADATSLTLGTFNHTEDEGTTTVPSCTVPGGTEYRCALCDTFIRYDETAPAPGHTYDENAPDSIEPLTCTTNEIKHYTCSTCSEQFIIITAYAAGHRYKVVSYPVVSTPGVDGIKRYTCSNFNGTCGDYYEFTYKMSPADLPVYITFKDGTKLTTTGSVVFNISTNELDRKYTCNLDSIKGDFTINGTKYYKSNIYSLSVPYGFTSVSKGFSESIAVIDLTEAGNITLSSTFQDKALEEIILGDGIIIDTDAFRNTDKLKRITIADGATIVFPSNKNPFNDVDNIKEIVIGKNANVRFEKSDLISKNNDSFTSITVGDGSTVYFGGSCFASESAFTTLNLGKGTYIFAGSSFKNTALTEVMIPEGSTVTFEGTDVFNGAKALTRICLPSSVTSIPKNTFSGCTALTEAYLLGVTSMADNAFYTGSDTAPLTIYHHAKDAFTYTSSSFGGRTTNGVILYTASNMTELADIPYTIYCGIPHTQYEHTENETCLENGYIGYKTDCPCGEAVYDVTYTVYTSTSDETTSGSYGSLVIIDEFDGHNNKTVVVFESFAKDGTKSVACERCGKVESTVVLGAIIKPIGYSIRDGGTGISTGYNLNKESLYEYELANGPIEIGIIMVNANDEFKGGFLKSDFTLNSTLGVQLKIGNKTNVFDRVNCSVVGFTDADVNLELIITSYVVYKDAEGNTKVEYIQRDGGEGYYVDTATPETNLAFGVMTIGQVKSILNAPGNIDTPKAIIPSNDEENA